MTFLARITSMCLTASLLLAPHVRAAQPDTASIRRRVDSNQRLMAAQLTESSDPLERSRLVDMLGTVRPSAIGPELRLALVRALARENLIQRDRARRDRKGEALHEQVDPELVLKLVAMVAQFRDQAHLQALAGAVGTGGRAVNAISDFGTTAVPFLLDVIDDVDPSDDEVDAVSGALIALRFILEEHGAEMAPVLRQRTRTVAMTRLSTPQRFVSTVSGALDLAIVDGSPALRARVMAVRDRPERSVVASYPDTTHFAWLRKQASERLAGVPALPKRQQNRR